MSRWSKRYSCGIMIFPKFSFIEETLTQSGTKVIRQVTRASNGDRQFRKTIRFTILLSFAGKVYRKMFGHGERGAIKSDRLKSSFIRSCVMNA